MGGQECSHRFPELLEVLLLFSELLPQLGEFLLLTLLDGEVLVGLLALLECVSV